MAKRILYIVLFAMILTSCSEKDTTASNRKLLIEQLNNSHSKQEWFVPSKIAVQGISSEQSKWRDSTANHSIKQLVSHLLFWNERNLMAFKGESLADFDDDNDSTFDNGSDWEILVKKLDSIQTEWEIVTQTTPADKLKEWKTEIANMASHTAYHTGQIIYIRKHMGWWK